jgi:hypothetical protein
MKPWLFKHIQDTGYSHDFIAPNPPLSQETVPAVFDVDNALTPEETENIDNPDLRSYDFGYDFTEYLNGIHNYYAIDWFRQATVEEEKRRREKKEEEEEDVVMGKEANAEKDHQPSQTTQQQVSFKYSPPSTEPKATNVEEGRDGNLEPKALNMDTGAGDNAPPSGAGDNAPPSGAGANVFGGGGKNNKSRKKRKKTKRRKTRRKRKKSIKNRRKKKLRKTKKRKKTKKRRKTKKRGKRKSN